MKKMYVHEAIELGLQMPNWQSKEIEEKRNALEPFKKFGTVHEMVNIEGEKPEDYRIWNFFALFEYKGFFMRPMTGRGSASNSFEFYAEYGLRVDSYTTKLQCPNRVGAPTEKKLNEWLDYLTSYEEEKAVEQARRTDKVEAFKNKIIASGFPLKNGSLEKNMGWILVGDVEFHFQIDNCGYIREEIRLKSQSFDTFLKLAK